MSKAGADIRRAAELGLKGPSDRGEYRICCPFCEGAGKVDTKFKMQLNPAKSLYHCYKCGAGGKADLEWLEPMAELPVDAEPPATQEFDAPPGFVPFFGNEHARSLQPYRRYIEARGMTKAFEACAGGACLTGPYAGRVVVPHVESSYRSGRYLASLGGEWAGFSARSIYPGVEPKYLYPKGMDRKRALWGGHLQRTPQILLVEGVFDALALYPSGVASFGKDVTDEQLDLFVRWCTDGSGIEGVVCLDGDAWEECAIVWTRLRLRGLDNVRWCKLPPGTDPGVLGPRVAEYIQG